MLKLLTSAVANAVPWLSLPPWLMLCCGERCCCCGCLITIQNCNYIDLPTYKHNHEVYFTFATTNLMIHVSTTQYRAIIDQNNLHVECKLAQVLWAKELTVRDNNNNDLFVNTANPGAVATKIWRDGTWNDQGAVGKFWSAFTSFHQSWFMWTPAEGALTPLYLGTAFEELREKDLKGQYFHPQSRQMEDHVLFPENNAERTKELQSKLWDFLDELVADFV